MTSRPFLILLLPIIFIVGSSALFAQNPQLHTKNGQRFPTVIFSFVFWSDNPSYYSIAIDSTGAATYQSAPDNVESTGVPYSIEFQANDSTRRTIFNVVRRSNFLEGDFPVSVGLPQKNPLRTLAYHDSTFNNQITYTESTDSDIQELTSVFEEISATLEFGRRLSYFHLHDKQRLGAELAAMQKEQQHHLLREVQAITTVLTGISSDPSIDETERQRAQTILHAH